MPDSICLDLSRFSLKARTSQAVQPLMSMYMYLTEHEAEAFLAVASSWLQKKWLFLSTAMGFAHRRLRIVHALQTYFQAPTLAISIGSLLVLQLDELLALAAHMDRPELVKRYYKCRDKPSVRYLVASKLATTPIPERIATMETPVVRIRGTVPLADWFSKAERLKMLQLILEKNSSVVIWEYVSRIPFHRLRRLFQKHHIPLLRKELHNRYALHAMLGNIPYIPWLKIPGLVASDPLNALLTLLGEANLTRIDLFLLPVAAGSVDGTCAICLTHLKNKHMGAPRETCCKHQFHKKCISVWLEEKITCPICRAQVILR